MNTPTGNTIATAELTFTHMLCGTRPIAQANSSIHSGVWDRKSFKGSELKNKVLAVSAWDASARKSPNAQWLSA